MSGPGMGFTGPQIGNIPNQNVRLGQMLQNGQPVQGAGGLAPGVMPMITNGPMPNTQFPLNPQAGQMGQQAIPGGWNAPAGWQPPIPHPAAPQVPVPMPGQPRPIPAQGYGPGPAAMAVNPFNFATGRGGPQPQQLPPVSRAGLGIK